MVSRRWFAFVLGGALGLACGEPAKPPPVGGLDASNHDSSTDAPPNVSCANYGGKCTAVPDASCPVQVTGIGLCEGELICCTGQ
jgi:hypothetical protein